MLLISFGPPFVRSPIPDTLFGYGWQETPELMLAPIYYAHHIPNVMSKARHSGETQALGPDA
jgi:S-adenosylmethionine synthetase